MARGALALDRQQQVVSGNVRRTMLPKNKSSQLPKLVVELAQKCVSGVPIVAPADPVSPCDSEDREGLQHACTSGCSCDTLYSSSSGDSSAGMCIMIDPIRDADQGGSGSGVNSQDLNLLTTPHPRILHRSTSDSSSGGGSDSPVPRAYQHDDDQDQQSSSSGGGSSGGGVLPHPPDASTSCPEDLQILSRTADRLSLCGFYYKGLNHVDARLKLKGRLPGTFILRDSFHSSFIYTLSTKTPRGTTSVRIAYTNGRFRLDCDDHLVTYMPRFSCILELIQYYILVSKRRGGKCVWYESSGRKDTPVILTTPLREHVLSLKHLTRKAVHTIVSNDKLDQLPVTAEHLQYLKEYPFHV